MDRSATYVRSLIRMDTAVSYLNGAEPGDAVQGCRLHRGFMFGYEHNGRMVTYFEDAHPHLDIVRGQKRVQAVVAVQPSPLRLYVYDSQDFGLLTVSVMAASREEAHATIHAYCVSHNHAPHHTLPTAEELLEFEAGHPYAVFLG